MAAVLGGMWAVSIALMALPILIPMPGRGTCLPHQKSGAAQCQDPSLCSGIRKQTRVSMSIQGLVLPCTVSTRRSCVSLALQAIPSTAVRQTAGQK